MNLSANCEGWSYDPSRSGNQLIGIRFRDPLSVSTPTSDRNTTSCVQCPKIAILLGCLSGKFEPKKDSESGKMEKMWNLNFTNEENIGDISYIVLVAVLR